MAKWRTAWSTPRTEHSSGELHCGAWEGSCWRTGRRGIGKGIKNALRGLGVFVFQKITFHFFDLLKKIGVGMRESTTMKV